MNQVSTKLKWKPFSRPLEAPVKSLVLIFLVWKLALLLIAAGSPGPGYDTSSLILFVDNAELGLRHAKYKSFGLIDRLMLKLFRWDAIYFVKIAERGFLHEQEWAFSGAFARILETARKVIPKTSKHPLRSHLLAGVAISNASHLLSVIVLYQLLSEVLGATRSRKVPFLAAALHIISPAGLFLSAPYCEALFSLLTFSGMLCFVRSQPASTSQNARSVFQDGFLLASGCCFALSTLMRSNGLLNGVIYLHEVASQLPSLLTFHSVLSDIRRIVVTSVAGVLVGFGFIAPQWLAYREYCLAKEATEIARPWCTRTLPSIYSWVQSHYWDVGFLRYWNLSNVPLFLLAAPMLWLLVRSSVIVLGNELQPAGTASSSPSKTSPIEQAETGSIGLSTLRKLTTPQLVVAFMALTSFHVQIINRISSGYPTWYLVVAQWLAVPQSPHDSRRSSYSAGLTIRWMVMYAIIQGALFAGFLPPA